MFVGKLMRVRPLEAAAGGKPRSGRGKRDGVAREATAGAAAIDGTKPYLDFILS
jgi:hypothetical protein